MNVLYLPHPPSYRIARNEAFYSSAASKGWFPEKHGILFSRFRKGEPRQHRYRIQLLPEGAVRPNGALSGHWAEEYSSRGWTPVCGHKSVFLFLPQQGRFDPSPSSPESAKEVCMANEARLRSHLYAIFVLPFVFLFSFLSLQGMTDTVLFALKHAAFLLFLLALWACILFLLVRASSGWRRLEKRLEAGAALNSPDPKSVPRRVAGGLLALLTALFLCLSAVQPSGSPQTIPENPDGPYVSLLQLEFDVPVKQGSMNTNWLRYYRSLLAEVWEVQGSVYYVSEAAEYFDYSIYQEVYRLPSSGLAVWTAGLLMDDSGTRYTSLGKELPFLTSYSYSSSDFVAVDTDAFDALWWSESDLAAVAVKDSTVWRIAFLDVEDGMVEDILALLAQVEP